MWDRMLEAISNLPETWMHTTKCGFHQESYPQVQRRQLQFNSVLANENAQSFNCRWLLTSFLPALLTN
jgi:hypothetical protein